MKFLTFLFATLFLQAFSLQAQIETTTWMGGFPGHETDWNTPQNWSEYRVPDEFDRVVIPQSKNFYPEIKMAATPVDALLVEAGAQIAILPGAKLTVTGESGFFDGITAGGQIVNNGILEIEHAPSSAFHPAMENSRGKGIIIFNSGKAIALQR